VVHVLLAEGVFEPLGIADSAGAIPVPPGGGEVAAVFQEVGVCGLADGAQIGLALGLIRLFAYSLDRRKQNRNEYRDDADYNEQLHKTECTRSAEFACHRMGPLFRRITSISL